MLVFISLIRNAQAQDGNISVETFINISKTSSLSTVSNYMNNLNYTLQYVKKDNEFKNSKDISWSYNMSYMKGIDKWICPQMGNFSYFKILFINDKLESFMYGFNDRKIYNSFQKNLSRYGYVKYEEKIDLETNSIILYYMNTQENSIIGLQEMVEKSDIPFIISYIK